MCRVSRMDEGVEDDDEGSWSCGGFTISIVMQKLVHRLGVLSATRLQ